MFRLTRDKGLMVGTFGLASGFLGEHLENTFFKVIACIDTVVVTMMWIWVSIKCIQQTVDGRLFFEKGFHESSSRRVLDSPQRKWRRKSSVTEDQNDGETAEGKEGSSHVRMENGFGMGNRMMECGDLELRNSRLGESD